MIDLFMCSMVITFLLVIFLLTGSITPTVELNGLAMKRGEPAIYRPLDQKPIPNYRANYNFRGMYNQRFVHFQVLFRCFSKYSQSWGNLKADVQLLIFCVAFHCLILYLLQVFPWFPFPSGWDWEVASGNLAGNGTVSPSQ